MLEMTDRVQSQLVLSTAIAFNLFFSNTYATIPEIAGRAHSMTLAHGTDQWDHALPTGNGQVGAMVYGHIENETIILTHDALYIRSEKPNLPEVAAYLPKIRQMIAGGQYDAAGDFLGGRLLQAMTIGVPIRFILPSMSWLIWIWKGRLPESIER